MKITCLGATRNITGSRFLVESKKSRILIDCGLYQEREFLARNWEKFPVKPATINTLLLTHAHIDHSGYLPKFIKEGFRGKVLCTPPTVGITKIALLDSAKLQEEDIRQKRKRHKREKRKGRFPEIPLYTTDDVRRTFKYLKGIGFKKKIKIAPHIIAIFHDAGHILGSSMIELKITENNKERICIFSGDIGRYQSPILNAPSTFSKADFVFMEATYGNRTHEDKEPSAEKFIRLINETKQAKGNIVIPSFAIEKAQELLYYIRGFLKDHKIPPISCFIDSPMAVDVTELFVKFSSYFKGTTRALFTEEGSPFEFPLLKTTRLKKDSKDINSLQETSIIIAGSGMCTGGRIKYHLKHNIIRPESLILFVGYQARGTLGREILERPKQIRIHGWYYPVRARIEKINGFSAHADKNELLRWITGFKKAPGKIFLIHSEEEVAKEFAARVREKIKSEVIIPEYLKEYVL